MVLGKQVYVLLSVKPAFRLKLALRGGSRNRSRSGHPVGLSRSSVESKTEKDMSDRVNKNDGEHSRNKGGRPKKGAAEKLKYKVSFFLQTGDYLALKTKVKATRLPRAEVVRRAVTGCRITPRFTPEQAAALRNLSGMGNNLNQLTKLAYQAGYSEIAAQNEQAVKEISQTLKLFRDDGEDS